MTTLKTELEPQAAPLPDELFAQADNLAIAGERFADMVAAFGTAIQMARIAARRDDKPDDEEDLLDEWDDALDSHEIARKAANTAARHLEILARRLRLTKASA